jgi:hypothetical protein
MCPAIYRVKQNTMCPAIYRVKQNTMCPAIYRVKQNTMSTLVFSIHMRCYQVALDIALYYDILSTLCIGFACKRFTFQPSYLKYLG